MDIEMRRHWNDWCLSYGREMYFRGGLSVHDSSDGLTTCSLNWTWGPVFESWRLSIVNQVWNGRISICFRIIMIHIIWSQLAFVTDAGQNGPRAIALNHSKCVDGERTLKNPDQLNLFDTVSISWNPKSQFLNTKLLRLISLVGLYWDHPSYCKYYLQGIVCILIK